MVQNQKTPSQYNSTLFISPQVSSHRQDLLITPPNPSAPIFESPGSNQSSFFSRSGIHNQSNDPHLKQNTSEDTEPLTQAEKLRLWRHDALMQHQYRTAEFIGDKVLALTNDPNDAFWLAQVHVNSGNYLRARHLLSSKPEYEKSVSCRYLAAYCSIKLEQWDEALDLIGETNPFKKEPNYNFRGSDGGIKLEASMCYLRGLVYANQNNFERAKESYKEAVLVDVKCYEAFNELINNNLMTPDEEWDLVNSLDYRDTYDNDELVRALYISRVSKYLNTSKFEEAENILSDEFDLGDNADILFSKADNLFVQCNFDECLTVCENILSKDPYNFEVVRNYLSCLHELGGRNKLFLIAHQLAENHPTHHITWLAIGIYYLSISKIPEARKYLSKATLLNPNFGQAWIGFAHTFAAEGEHEQAISAYAFAARLFPGTHLPNLFLGMQHLQMNNLKLSEEYLSASYHICKTDPLLLNEIGVINFHKNDLVRAEAFFQEALVAARHLNSDSKTWISIHANLAHVYRRNNQLTKSLEFFDQVLRVSNKNDSNILAAIGLIQLKLGNYFKAIDTLHDALAISPSDPVASDLLKRALESNKNNSSYFLRDTMEKSEDLNLPTFKYRFKKNKQKHTADASSTDIVTSLDEKGNENSSQGPSDSLEIEYIAESYKRGNESSDEDDEVMDIESVDNL